MLICGFAGIGKSQAAKKYPNVVDLESTPFEKDFDRYVKVAIHMHKNGMTVLLSCHEELRAELNRQGIEYICVIPKLTDWEVYYDRYKNRGNTINFINMMYANWEIWITEILQKEKNVYELPERATLSQELYNIEEVLEKKSNLELANAQLMRVSIPPFSQQFVIEKQFDPREGETFYLKYFRDIAITPISISQEEDSKSFTIQDLHSSESYPGCTLKSYFSEKRKEWVKL